jgi:flavoprotein
MPAPRLAWAITGSGHYIEECLEFLLKTDCRFTEIERHHRRQ